MKKLILTTLFVITAFSPALLINAASFELVGENEIPEFWGGIPCYDCSTSGVCADLSPCSTFQFKEENCIVNNERENTATGYSKGNGTDDATLSDFGKCANIWTCLYWRPIKSCSRGNSSNQNWYRTCNES